MRRSRIQFEYLDCDPIAMAHQAGGDVVGMENRNSMAAMQSASDLGYLYTETDVLVSRDEFVFLAHGAANANELEGATGTSNMLRSEVEQLDYADAYAKYGGGEYGHMPLLIDVLTSFPNMRYNIDMKTKRGALFVPQVILAANAIDRVLLTSFDYSTTKAAAEQLGGQERVCTSAGIRDSVALLARAMMAEVRPYTAKARLAQLAGTLVTEASLHTTKAACFQLPLDQEVPGTRGKLTVHTVAEMVAIAREHGMQTHLWTLNDPTQIHQALDMGAGVISDESELTKSIFVQRGYWDLAA